MKPKIGRTISVILFSLGVLLGLLLAGSFIWAHLELPLYFDYDFTSIKSDNQEYSKLICPYMLTTPETGQISVKIPNTADKSIDVSFLAHISYLGGAARQLELTSTIPVGGSRDLKFEVNAQDVFYNYFILVKTYQYPTYKTPSRMGSCAILLVPLTFLTGDQVLIISILLLGFFLLTGIFLWIKFNRPLRGMTRNALNAMTLLAILLAVAFYTGLAGWWVPGVLLLAVVVLQIFVAFSHFSSGFRDDRE